MHIIFILTLYHKTLPSVFEFFKDNKCENRKNLVRA